jgi:hypothetical protein
MEAGKDLTAQDPRVTAHEKDLEIVAESGVSLWIYDQYYGKLSGATTIARNSSEPGDQEIASRDLPF